MMEATVSPETGKKCDFDGSFSIEMLTFCKYSKLVIGGVVKISRALNFLLQCALLPLQV